MLLTFRVSNFLSFNDEVEFSMLSGKVRDPASHVVTFGKGNNRVQVLKSAVLYGANASGKSNLVKAMDFAKSVIRQGLKRTYYSTNHFRLSKDNDKKPSKFEFEFIINQKVYAYGFEALLSRKQIVEEWLYELKKDTDKPIFERISGVNDRPQTTAEPKLIGEDMTRFRIYSQDVPPSELLLSKLGELEKDEESGLFLFSEIYNWFENQLVIFYPDSKLDISGMIIAGDESKSDFCSLLQYFKTGIDDMGRESANAEELLERVPKEVKIRILENLDKGKKYRVRIANKRITFSKDEKGQVIAYQIFTKRKLKNLNEYTNFEFDDESDGTRRLFDIIPLLQLLSKNSATVIIDEIDRSLHPELTRKLIESFFALSARKLSGQLILTTHESSLLDLSFLRRDEIWFVEKNNDGESKLYSLEEFKPRFDAEIRKAYLQGRFGAIPFIADVEQLGWN